MLLVKYIPPTDMTDHSFFCFQTISYRVPHKENGGHAELLSPEIGRTENGWTQGNRNKQDMILSLDFDSEKFPK